MNNPSHILHSSFFILLFLLSCSVDEYDKGEGAYSLTTADFVEAHVNAEKEVDYVLTDDGDSLRMASPFEASWKATPDTLYRMLLYYNKVDGQVKPVDFSLISTITPHHASYFKYNIAKDPVHFESVWMSRTGKYLNLSLRIMTGNSSVDGSKLEKQLFGIVADTLITHPDGKRTQWLTLYHSQTNQPEYFSVGFYVSIRTSRTDQDSIGIKINTYEGEKRRVVATNH